MFRLCLKGTDTAQLVATRVRDTGSEAVSVPFRHSRLFLTLGVFFRSVAFFFQMQHAIGVCFFRQFVAFFSHRPPLLWARKCHKNYVQRRPNGYVFLLRVYSYMLDLFLKINSILLMNRTIADISATNLPHGNIHFLLLGYHFVLGYKERHWKSPTHILGLRVLYAVNMNDMYSS